MVTLVPKLHRNFAGEYTFILFPQQSRHLNRILIQCILFYFIFVCRILGMWKTCCNHLIPKCAMSVKPLGGCGMPIVWTSCVKNKSRLKGERMKKTKSLFDSDKQMSCFEEDKCNRSNRHNQRNSHNPKLSLLHKRHHYPASLMPKEKLCELLPTQLNAIAIHTR
jgi:hypothetical protein